MDTPSAGRFEDGAHYLPARVYYEDTDFSGAIYHANYLRFFERGRSEFLRLAGVGHDDLLARPDPCAFAVTKINVSYLRAGSIDEALVIRTRYVAIKAARIFIEQELLRDGVPICTASVEIVCIKPGRNGAGSVRRPPREVLDALTPYLSA